MNIEIQSIIRNLQNVNSGQPWYGKPVYALLEEVNPVLVYRKPSNTGHSLIDLLYHMITWAGFVLKRVEGETEKDPAAFEKLDWRPIDPVLHSWEKGMEEFKSIHSTIIRLLESKENDFLKEMVEGRNFNFRFMLNGLIQHNIYHAGQIAFLNKILEKE